VNIFVLFPATSSLLNARPDEQNMSALNAALRRSQGKHALQRQIALSEYTGEMTKTMANANTLYHHQRGLADGPSNLPENWPFKKPKRLIYVDEECCACTAREPLMYGPCGHVALCIPCCKKVLKAECPKCRCACPYFRSIPFALVRRYHGPLPEREEQMDVNNVD
jgi:hypothetical protein